MLNSTSWKTTSAGIIAITSALIGLYFAIKNKSLTPEVITGCISGLLAGVGLLLAKDSDITGGSRSNNESVK